MGTRRTRSRERAATVDSMMCRLPGANSLRSGDGAKHVRSTDCTDSATPEHRSAPITPEYADNGPPAGRVHTIVLLSAYIQARGPSAGKSDRRRDVSGRLEDQPRTTLSRGGPDGAWIGGRIACPAASPGVGGGLEIRQCMHTCSNPAPATEPPFVIQHVVAFRYQPTVAQAEKGQLMSRC